jgi:hypothetical protein
MQEESSEINKEKMTILVQKIAARISELPFPENSKIGIGKSHN